MPDEEKIAEEHRFFMQKAMELQASGADLEQILGAFVTLAPGKVKP